MNDSAPKPGVNIARILVIVVPVVLILAGVLAVVRYGEDLGLTGKRTPKLVEVKGKIIFRDKPMAGGTIQTLFVDDPTLTGAYGEIDDQGNFTLETAVIGEIKPGLFVGKHKVMVYNYLPSIGPAQGPLVTPAKYSRGETTPIEIEITAQSANEPLEFVLEVDENTPTEEFVANYLAEMPARLEQMSQMSAGRPSGPPTDNGGPAGATGGRGGGFDPEAFFAERDADDNGKLAGDEIPDRLRERLEEIDTDQDGEISKEEFDASRPPEGRGGRGGPAGDSDGGNE